MQVKAHMAEVNEQVKQGDVTSKGKQKLSDKENNQHPPKKIARCTWVQLLPKSNAIITTDNEDKGGDRSDDFGFLLYYVIK
jgi:hypothetical protein